MRVLTFRFGQLSANVLGIVSAILLLSSTLSILLIFFPQSGPSELLRQAFFIGWPGAIVLVALLCYFQFGRRQDPHRSQWAFNTVIGLFAYSILCLAIANFKINYFGNSRLLPLSLVMITALSFMMAVYFVRVSALLKIGGFMFLVAATLSGFGNWLPQVEGGFPPKGPVNTGSIFEKTPQQIADIGETLIFGGIGKSRKLGAIGKGQCPLCHGFWKDSRSDRAPNLLGIPTRATTRLSDPEYQQESPAARKTVQKESCLGCGTAQTALEYIAESHVCPSCFVVAGFGKKGSDDTDSPMPMVHKAPISLSLEELIAIETWLFMREGHEPPAPEEIEAAYLKFSPSLSQPPDDGPKGDLPTPGNPDLIPVVSGDEPVEEIFSKALCITCHTIPGIAGAVGQVGPRLVEKTNAPLRLKDPAYQGEATSVREYILESIVDPSKYVAKPYQDNLMPKDFGKKLNGAALNKVVNYLANIEK